ncbi:hypothetical protein DPMN_031326 [Dreissena polymorpha]|uniref:Uncharacterized protein n=1 Tax=Dreissena polymorpha TaxID=45954 RepID=A0A9D4RH04_DREPO|nr:hypothetical protein DPMN_031326 [Dreissena polymorpha]
MQVGQDSITRTDVICSWTARVIKTEVGSAREDAIRPSICAVGAGSARLATGFTMGAQPHFQPRWVARAISSAPVTVTVRIRARAGFTRAHVETSRLTRPARTVFTTAEHTGTNRALITARNAKTIARANANAVRPRVALSRTHAEIVDLVT